MSKTFKDGKTGMDGKSVEDRAKGRPRKGASEAAQPARVPAGPWSMPVRRDAVPETGLHVAVLADAPVRRALTEIAHVIDVSHAQASFDLSRRGEGLRVVGMVRGAVIQECIVTLEPLENEIAEAVDVTFLPPALTTPEDAASGDPAIDPPEPLVDDAVDLGQLATEYLLIGIDPYPRKPDAEFVPPPAGAPDAGPFAALEALKAAAQKKDRKN